MKVYEVLTDTKKALAMLESDLCDDMDNFRIIYIAALSLLRAAGHVLHKVDCDGNPILKKAVADHWNRLKAHSESNQIFFEFIEKERNHVLKEYEIGFDDTDWEVVYPDGDDYSTYNLGELYRPLKDGAFDGADCRNLINEGIAWWEEQLAEIVSLISQVPQ